MGRVSIIRAGTKKRIGTIIKCDECPECGRKLNE